MYRKEETVLPEQTELAKRNILRLSNEESHRITRECIETALMQLMKENEFDKITVTDIIVRAGVSRSAYYRNYHTKEDVLAQIFENAVDMVVAGISLPLWQQDQEQCFLALFRTLEKNRKLLKVVINAGMEKQLVNSINDRLIRRLKQSDDRSRYMVLSWVGSTMNIIFDWCRRGMQSPPEEMAALCVSLQVGGVADFQVASRF